VSLRDYKGSIAGIYSLTGGAGILFITKIGGVLFDNWSTTAPFLIMLSFNALLLVVIVYLAVRQAVWGPTASPPWRNTVQVCD